MAVSKEELGKALQIVAEQMHQIDERIAKLEAGLLAVKAMLSLQVNPSQPIIGLGRIEDFQQRIAAADPSAPVRKTISDVIEMLKAIEKCGGAKDA